MLELFSKLYTLIFFSSCSNISERTRIEGLEYSKVLSDTRILLIPGNILKAAAAIRPSKKIC